MKLKELLNESIDGIKNQADFQKFSNDIGKASSKAIKREFKYATGDVNIDGKLINGSHPECEKKTNLVAPKGSVILYDTGLSLDCGSYAIASKEKFLKSYEHIVEPEGDKHGTAIKKTGNDITFVIDTKGGTTVSIWGGSSSLVTTPGSYIVCYDGADDFGVMGPKMFELSYKKQ